MESNGFRKKDMVYKMKFLHTGDLHIGKIVNDFSMIEDQKYILEQIIEIAKEEKVDAVVVAGDVYDRAIPSADAVTLLNMFLTQLVRLNISAILISGNHDSPERIEFAEEILQENNVYIAGVYRESLKKVKFTDEYGEITFVLLPFIKPASAEAKTSGEAVKNILSHETLDRDGRQVLVTHFFVTNDGKEPELSDSETTIHVGGLDNVEASLFKDFDYVALGHIHKPQQIKDQPIYYAGSPLAYSFSEAGKTKTVNLVEIKTKGDMTVRQLPLLPLHEMRKIRGSLKELMEEEVVKAANPFDYIQAQLTNEEELIDPIGALRSVYPNVMQIILLKNESKGKEDYESKMPEKRKSIPELFSDFYGILREEEPDEKRLEVIIETAREAERDGDR